MVTCFNALSTQIAITYNTLFGLHNTLGLNDIMNLALNLAENSNATLASATQLSEALQDKAHKTCEVLLSDCRYALTRAETYDALPGEEKTKFTVVLKDAGPNKIPAIKIVRDITSLILGDAKKIIDNVPSIIIKNISRVEAEAIKEQFASIGATVEIK